MYPVLAHACVCVCVSACTTGSVHGGFIALLHFPIAIDRSNRKKESYLCRLKTSGAKMREEELESWGLLLRFVVSVLSALFRSPVSVCPLSQTIFRSFFLVLTCRGLSSPPFLSLLSFSLSLSHFQALSLLRGTIVPPFLSTFLSEFDLCFVGIDSSGHNNKTKDLGRCTDLEKWIERLGCKLCLACNDIIDSCSDITFLFLPRHYFLNLLRLAKPYPYRNL